MRHKLSLLFGIACGSALLASTAFSAASSAPITAPVTAPASASANAPLKDVMPLPSQGRVDQTVAGLLAAQHYDKPALDDKQSALIFDQYMQDLDPNKSYFVQADIDGFSS